MEIGLILLSAGFAIAIILLIIGNNPRTRRTKRNWMPQRNQPRVRAVGPCAVAVGVYKTYEDRKLLEKIHSESKLKTRSPD